MEKYFEFSERKTSYKQEFIGGLTTFLSMAYILVVNPLVLSESGMDKGAVFTATAITAIIGSLLIGILANYPIGIAPSIGLNSFFTYSVVLGMGIRWEVALTGVFISGILFVLLSVLKVREKIINVIPKDLKYAIAGGIGFFVAFIGLKNAKIIVAHDATFVALGNFTSGPTALALFGFIITSVMLVRGIRGGIFYGMVISSIVGMIFGIIEKPSSIIGSIPSMEPTFGVVFSELPNVFTPDLIVVIFTFLFVGFFDTAGTLIAVASQAGILKDNKIPNAGPALLADSSSSVLGAVLGTSTTASFIESTAGIAAGARTGFASIVISGFFLLSLLFSPLLSVVTSEITSPALIIVGAMMVAEVRHIDWMKLDIAIPAFTTIIMMPLTFSVATGIALGFIMYPVTMIALKKHREVHPIMYILFVTFIAYFVYIS